jgi:hypothetical protein
MLRCCSTFQAEDVHLRNKIAKHKNPMEILKFKNFVNFSLTKSKIPDCSRNLLRKSTNPGIHNFPMQACLFPILSMQAWECSHPCIDTMGNNHACIDRGSNHACTDKMGTTMLAKLPNSPLQVARQSLDHHRRGSSLPKDTDVWDATARLSPQTLGKRCPSISMRFAQDCVIYGISMHEWFALCHQLPQYYVRCWLYDAPI